MWNERLLRGAFWSLNIGLALMALLTLLPLGVLQLQAALEHGYWYARSAEFMQQPIIHAAGLDARARRHDLQHRRAAARLVRAAAVDRRRDATAGSRCRRRRKPRRCSSSMPQIKLGARRGGRRERRAVRSCAACWCRPGAAGWATRGAGPLRELRDRHGPADRRADALAILPLAVFANTGSPSKLALLAAYVVLGWLALRRAATRRARAVYFAAALLAYAPMFGIARAHDPLVADRLAVGAESLDPGQVAAAVNCGILRWRSRLARCSMTHVASLPCCRRLSLAAGCGNRDIRGRGRRR